MKKLLSILLLLAVSLSLSTDALAQKKKKKSKQFSGTITYELTYSGDDLQPAMLAQAPKEQTIKISGNKSIIELIEGPMVMTSIMDGDNKTMLILLDIMGTKKYLKFTKEKIEERNSENTKPIVKIADETKIICGYTAKKAIVTTVDEFGDSTSTTVWYSPDLGSKDLNFYNPRFSEIDGAPLEYEELGRDMTVHYLAKEIKKGKVKDIEFLLPTGYEEFTPEEKEMMKGITNPKDE